jgi:CheY-like chemotaxis protein
MAFRILFLDDNKYRHQKMKPILLHDEAYTVAEAFDLLLKKKYDVVFLDHDLGGEEMVNSDRGDTGMEVAKLIADNEIIVDLVVVHSCNPAGASNMVSYLKQGGVNVIQVPFTQLPARIDSILEEIRR